MAINFPTSPTTGDLYIYNGVIYRWDGQFWSPVAGGPTAVGDANYTILPTDAFVYTSATFTAPRTWTLPLASSYRAGRPLTITDIVGTFYQPLTVQRAGGDTISGATAFVMSTQFQSMTFEGDGVSKWVIVATSPLSLFSTGDLKPTHKNFADPGWILWADGTIGDVSSGSNVRANYDTASLFSIYYNVYDDTDCPIFTSAGGATTRGAAGGGSNSWPTAFTTNQCRISLPKGSGRSLSIMGAGAGLTSRGLGDAIGAETETPTLAKTASHNHNPIFGYGGDAGAPAAWRLAAIAGGPSQVDLSAYINTANAGSGSALNIMNPASFVNIMIKL